MRSTTCFDSVPLPEHLTPHEMLTQMNEVNVLAPLVRCSKLPFRQLVSEYETHITHTPMMLAAEFSRAQTARISDFTTSRTERGVFWMEDRIPATRDRDSDQSVGSSKRSLSSRSRPDDGGSEETLPRRRSPSKTIPPRPPSDRHRLVRGLVIAQFAASEGKTLADACEIISVRPEQVLDQPQPLTSSGEFVGRPRRSVTMTDTDEPSRLVDGIDLNCGCPQPWAYSEGIGSALLRKPELVADMVKQVHARMGNDFGISVKIRVDDDPKLTERLVQSAIHAHVTHLTIHGRTRHQASTEPVNLDRIRFAVECAQAQVPCVGNGDIWTLQDAHAMREHTGVRGVMAARGLLANPGLFAGYDSTPQEAVETFSHLSLDYGLPFNLYQRHLSYMLESTVSKYDRLYLNSLCSYAGVTDWLEQRGMNLTP